MAPWDHDLQAWIQDSIFRDQDLSNSTS